MTDYDMWNDIDESLRQGFLMQAVRRLWINKDITWGDAKVAVNKRIEKLKGQS
jgi:hypothetical protein